MIQLAMFDFLCGMHPTVEGDQKSRNCDQKSLVLLGIHVVQCRAVTQKFEETKSALAYDVVSCCIFLFH